MVAVEAREPARGAAVVAACSPSTTARSYEIRCQCGTDLVEFPFPVRFTFDGDLTRVRKRGWRWSLVERSAPGA